MDKFLTSVLHSALVADARLSSHPIVHDVKNPDEITSAFDEISYKKVRLNYSMILLIYYLIRINPNYLLLLSEQISIDLLKIFFILGCVNNTHDGKFHRF